MTHWKITQMDRDTATGFVLTVHWTAVLEADDLTASTYSTVSFTLELDQQLIPYDQLTESLVVSWVKAALGEAGVEAVESALASNIQEQLTPKTAVGLPW